jgi:hypothetical protein
VANYLKGCVTCQRQIPIKKCPAALHPIPVTEDVFLQLGADLIGPLTETHHGNRYILVICDYLSKFVIAEPIVSKTADCVHSVFRRIFLTFGPPNVLITDQGREFVNGKVDNLCRMMNVEHRKTSPYHPQTNGLTGRQLCF